ncbi:MAG TPA: diacylglycerol kinase family protein [Vicinamibacterales bacterium]|nr:diacylglycerol kinase family protein [Vicinamibacterales bacterium]HOQ59661.1 diacylglycerol kinase family protein [Vicinamibacterales bacterium]HPK70556.1 diacylglycerol kinase family protein [Vicinamibacterales bacterium]
MTPNLHTPGPVRPGARIAFVVNRAARQGRDGRVLADAARLLGERYEVETVTPAGPEGVEAAARAAAAAHDAIVVAGGDGTINRAVNGLAGSALPAGIVPLGTGNDFARAMGIPASPAAAVRVILAGRTRAVDLVRVNGRLFCTVGIIGVPADAALTVANLTGPRSRARCAARRLGDLAYSAAGLWHVLRPGSFVEPVAVAAGGGGAAPSADRLPPGQVPVHAAFVTNTAMLGGGMTVPVGADPADGMIEFAIVPRMPRVRLLAAFRRFTGNRPLPPGILRFERAARATITCSRAVRFSADGDLICEGDRFDVEVLPGALTLIG